MYNGWYGVDLDATLAEYDKFNGPTIIGKPIPKMIERVKQMLTEGKDVRIFTARVWPLGTIDSQSVTMLNRTKEAAMAYKAIEMWCLENIGKILPITCVKDYGMIYLYDDRAKQVIPNTGELIEDKYNALKSSHVYHEHKD